MSDVLTGLRNKGLLRLAAITRAHPFRGSDALLRLLYSPDARQHDFFDTIVPYDRGRIQVRTSSFIEWSVLFHGGYEPELRDFIRQHINRESVAIDVGANIGVHTIVLSRGSRVIAVEPSPSIAARLRQNLRLSAIENVEIVEAAISEESGETTFYPPSPSFVNQGIGSLNKSRPGALIAGIQVPTFTLDQLAENLPRLDFVKIDTEGRDCGVLLSGRQVLARHHPTLVFEWAEDDWKAAGYAFDDARVLLEELGYELGVLEPAYIRERRLRPLDERRDFALIAAVHHSRTA